MRVKFSTGRLPVKINLVNLHREFVFFLPERNIGGIISSLSFPTLWCEIYTYLFNSIERTLQKLHNVSMSSVMSSIGVAIKESIETLSNIFIEGRYIDANLGIVGVEGTTVYILLAGDVKCYLYHNKSHRNLWDNYKPSSLKNAYKLYINKYSIGLGALLLLATSYSFSLPGLGAFANSIYNTEDFSSLDLLQLCQLFLSPLKEYGSGGACLLLQLVE